MMKKLLVTMFVAAAMVATANAQTDVLGMYDGSLSVDLGFGGEPTVSTDTIYLEASEMDGFYKVSIKDFSFSGFTLGDITVDSIQATEADGVVTLTREGIVEGPISGTLITFGETTITGNALSLNLSVDVNNGGMTVSVSFEGTKITESGETGIASLVADQAEITVWGNEMMVRGAAEYTIYNTAGVPVQQGVADGSIISLDNLGGGIYLVKAGNCIEKFIKK